MWYIQKEMSYEYMVNLGSRDTCRIVAFASSRNSSKSHRAPALNRITWPSWSSWTSVYGFDLAKCCSFTTITFRGRTVKTSKWSPLLRDCLVSHEDCLVSGEWYCLRSRDRERWCVHRTRQQFLRRRGLRWIMSVRDSNIHTCLLLHLLIRQLS